MVEPRELCINGSLMLVAPDDESGSELLSGADGGGDGSVAHTDTPSESEVMAGCQPEETSEERDLTQLRTVISRLRALGSSTGSIAFAVGGSWRTVISSLLRYRQPQILPHVLSGIPLEVCEILVFLYCHGTSARAIAEEFDCTESTVLGWLLELGININSVEVATSFGPEANVADRRELIRFLGARNVSIRTIAAAVQCDVKTVMSTLHMTEAEVKDWPKRWHLSPLRNAELSPSRCDVATKSSQPNQQSRSSDVIQPAQAPSSSKAEQAMSVHELESLAVKHPKPRKKATSKRRSKAPQRHGKKCRPSAKPKTERSAVSGPVQNWVQCDACHQWRRIGDLPPDGKRWECKDNTSDPVYNTCSAPEESDSLAGDEFVVERLLRERITASGKTEFLVRWLGWGPEHDSWEPESNIKDPALVDVFRGGGAYPSELPKVVTLWAFVAPCPSLGGRGLFARADIVPNQAICAYFGPIVHEAEQYGGMHVLRLNDTPLLIDGDCTNSWYEAPRSPAIYANHSALPNARLEYWPRVVGGFGGPYVGENRVARLQADTHNNTITNASAYDVCGEMWLVSNELIQAGAEIRIDYESGGEDSYWKGMLPSNHDEWRDFRQQIEPLPEGIAPPSAERAAVNVLQDVLDSNRRNKPLPPSVFSRLAAIYPTPLPPLPWNENDAELGDARLRRLAPIFVTNRRASWGLLASHIPGRTGLECRERWKELRALPERAPPPLASEPNEKRGRRRPASSVEREWHLGICTTPGCQLPDFHEGACSHLRGLGPRLAPGRYGSLDFWE